MNEYEAVHAKLAVRSDGASRLLLTIAAAALAVALMFFALAYWSSRDAQWDPLGDYPTQQVLNKNHTVGRDETVDVTAQKCAREPKVAIRATLSWVPVDHSEFAVTPNAPGRLSYRYSSCGKTPDVTIYSYTNPIPPGVLAILDQRGLHSWRITGTDTPFDEEGKPGVPRTWTTETFTIE